MKIAILGATGTTGSLAIAAALAAGHDVVAYVRSPQAVPARDRLTVIGGAIDDADALRAAFVGVDAVISCLGARMTPTTPLRGTDFQRRSLPVILAAIAASGVKRFVLMSSFGVGATARKASLVPRVLFYGLIAKKLFDDKAVAERSLDGSSVAWTAVYPVGLKAGPASSAYRLVRLDDVEHVPGIPMVTFATVAAVLVSLASSVEHTHEKLLLTIP